MGLDDTLLLAVLASTETSEKVGNDEKALKLIEQSGLFDVENFNDLLSFDTEDDGPDRGFSRVCYEQSFRNNHP